MAAEEDAVEVHGDDAHPLLGRQLLERRAGDVGAGVVEQQVEPPNSRFSFAKASATEAGSATSAGSTSVRAPRHIPAVSSSASARRPSSATVQPSSASAIAEARPTPEPPPP
jgi:hypothetical protein